MAMHMGMLEVFSSGNAHLPLKSEGFRGSNGRTPYTGTSFLVIRHCRPLAKFCFVSPTFALVSSSGPRRGELGKRLGVNGFVVLADANYEREETRWLREEQRWLREEQRWLREEQRWLRDEVRWSEANRALQEEVAVLKQELLELKGQNAQMQVTDTSLKTLVAGMRTLLQALSAPVIEDSASSEKQIRSTGALAGEVSDAFIVEKTDFQITPVTFVASPDKVIAIVTPETGGPRFSPNSTPKPEAPTSSQEVKETPKSRVTSTTKRTLKSGMEGDDVKELQDALAELGFYSGEEEIEFSMFAGDTARAVKTWQSSIEIAEDGVVTPELLARLLAEVATKGSTKDDAKKSSSVKSKPVEHMDKTYKSKQDTSNRREVDESNRSTGQTSWTISSRRVYLLGENRWEEPDRLINLRNEEKNKNGISTGMKVKVEEKCFSCRGQGTTLCTECEGTGDINVEEQFLEWTGEDAKCPYCEGTGFLECDICYGKGMKTLA